MFKGEFKFNLEDALTTFSNKYIDTYASTNEPIEKWMALTPVKHAPRVLTVAASGDQPLMYAANGAAHVDTFDLTVYACAAMDFKTTALQHMSYSNYVDEINVLKRFRYLETLKIYGIMSDYNDTMNIINNMPMRTRQLMQGAVDVRPAAFERDRYNKNIFPADEQTYAKMQQAVKAPFNFIWSDLLNLTHYIEGKYDIINISNIFDHYISEIQNKSVGDIFETMQNLLRHTNQDGYILFTTFDSKIPYLLRKNQNALKNMLQVNISFKEYKEYPDMTAVVLQKTR